MARWICGHFCTGEISIHGLEDAANGVKIEFYGDIGNANGISKKQSA